VLQLFRCLCRGIDDHRGSDLAKLKLESTQVTSPIVGKMSGSILSAGNVVVADTTVLATVGAHGRGSAGPNFRAASPRTAGIAHQPAIARKKEN
jgi:hypothetical protein